MRGVDPLIWQQITQHVIVHGGNIIRPWFTQLEPVALEHGLLEIRCPGPVELKYLEQHAGRLFTEAAQQATGRLVGVSFFTPDSPDPVAGTIEIPVGTPIETLVDELPLQPDYTFEAFVTGPCNRLAHAASLAVSESPGQTYNPLFVHGASGLGKSHLLHAVCHEVRRRNPDARLCILSCETFVNHFIEAVEQGKLHEFRYRYRHADLLVIDDVQFLSEREQTQEEFFHTFNTLYQAHKQIILSCDRSPAEIPHLEARLVSRFNWGLVARIDRPCYETRVAIVRRKARLRNLDLPDDVICMIAGSIDSNTRELEGAISKVAMLAKVYDRPLDLALAAEALGAATPRVGNGVTIERILEAVMGRFGVRLADLQSKKRSRSIAFPRQICMYLARNLTRHSLEEIGGYFGGRDHTTVLHAHRTIEAARAEDPQLHGMLEQLSRELERMG